MAAGNAVGGHRILNKTDSLFFAGLSPRTEGAANFRTFALSSDEKDQRSQDGFRRRRSLLFGQWCVLGVNCLAAPSLR
jgi:hypothetical protein